MTTTDGVRDAPTVYLVIGNSTIAFDEKNEVLETVDYFTDGSPDWSAAAICDYRGAAGAKGYELLRAALTAAETNAHMAGYDVQRLPGPS